MPTTDTSVCTQTRVWLREETAPAHDRVDRAFSAFDLARDPDLFAFLRAQGAGLAAARAALEAHGRGDWAAVLDARLSAIAHDLGEKLTPTISPLHVSEPAGVAYVCAGSLHGTAVLRARVQRLRPGRCVPRFFDGRGWKPMWAEVLSELESLGRTEALLASANATFAAFAEAAHTQLHVEAA